MENIPVIKYCKVISVEDKNDTDMIKVRMSPDDNTKSDNEIDVYAFPLLPKMLHVKPKENEGVFVLTAIGNKGYTQRYYIGPVISQDHRIYQDPYFMGGDSFFAGAPKALDVAPQMLATAKGTLPNNDDIVIRGRKNCDIQITNDDIRIKAGVKIKEEGNDYNVYFNDKDPAYAKLKYHTTPLNDGSKSTATIVADKINLLSNTSPNSFSLTNRDDLITDKELNKVLEEGYRLPYGDKLVEFLKTFVEAFLNHTHNFAMESPNPYYTETLRSESNNLLEKEQLLSDTVRIN